MKKLYYLVLTANQILFVYFGNEISIYLFTTELKYKY